MEWRTKHFRYSGFLDPKKEQLLLRCLIITLLLFCAGRLTAQTADTMKLTQLYDRCLDFAEDKVDSIRYYASYIEQQTAETGFSRGKVFSLRLRGIAADLSLNYSKAIDFYLQSLEEARRLHSIPYEIAALSDLAIIYDHINQPKNAKLFYLKSLPLVQQSGEISTLLSTYNNLAVIYTHLGQYDSARILLDECLSYEKLISGPVDLSSTYNNLGNVYFYQKKYDMALRCFRRNLKQHIADSSADQVWIDHLNLADVFIETKTFDSAQFYANKALSAAQTMQSKSKEADSYSLMAKLEDRLGNYQKAYEYLKLWHTLDTALVNAQTNSTIASLQERYNAREREAENSLLQARITQQHTRTQNITVIAIALGALAILSVMALLAIRRAKKKLEATHQLIIRQKQKLEDLNHEKNALLSIVSHDLGAPFAGIKMWAQVLQAEEGELNSAQQKAISRIIESGDHGEKMIAHILDVERSDLARHKLNLERINASQLLQQVTESFEPAAREKQITLALSLPDADSYLLSDALLLQRILENLLSNALKFTPPGKSVQVSLKDMPRYLDLEVADEGIGISPEDLPRLFNKYANLSGKPTAGESSHGLGLSLVKRMVDELNGTIHCSSESGIGTRFTVRLTK